MENIFRIWDRNTAFLKDEQRQKPVQGDFYAHTVKPANNDHLWDIGKVVVIRRWSPFGGRPIVMAQTKKNAQIPYSF